MIDFSLTKIFLLSPRTTLLLYEFHRNTIPLSRVDTPQHTYHTHQNPHPHSMLILIVRQHRVTTYLCLICCKRKLFLKELDLTSSQIFSPKDVKTIC